MNRHLTFIWLAIIVVFLCGVNLQGTVDELTTRVESLENE